MSQENVEVVRQIMAAFRVGDEDGVLRHLDPEVDWRPTGFLTGERIFHGPEEVREWLRDVAALSQRGTLVRTFDTTYRDLGDSVLVLGSGKLERPTGTIHQELGWIWELEDGAVLSMTNYLGHREAVCAAGLER